MQQLAHAAHAAVAEVVNVVRLADAVCQAAQVVDGREHIVRDDMLRDEQVKVLLDGFLEEHILHLHQPRRGGAVIFIQLHGDIPNRLLGVRDHHIFQRVNPAAGLFDLLRHELGGFFDLRQLEHLLKHLAQRVYGSIQLTGGGRKAIGIDIRIGLGLRLEIIDGNIDGHDVLHGHRQLHALLGIEQRLLHGLGAHQGGSHGKRLVNRHQFLFHLCPQGTDLPHGIQKLLHQLVPLVLEQFVAPLSGAQLALEAGQLHSGGVYRDVGHWSPLLTPAGLFSANISQYTPA